MKVWMKLIAMVLVAALCMNMLSSVAFTMTTVQAADGTASGTCGDNLTWDLKDGVLTISGYGDMEDYKTYGPWGNYANNPLYNLHEVVICDGVTSIGKRAFYGCSVTIDEIPDSVKKIGTEAFWGASFADTSLVLSKNVEEIGTGVFRNTNLTSVKITNEEMTEIPSQTFYQCTDLVSVTLPDTVQKINSEAFAGATALKQINWPSSLVEIGQKGFDNCDSLTEVILPDQLQKIGKYAFWYSDNLEHVYIPGSVTTMGASIFQYCPKLKTVGDSDSYNIELGWKKGDTIVSNAFSNCNNIESVTIPAGVSVGSSAFTGSKGIETVYANAEGIKSIEAYAFKGCTGLKTILLSQDLKSIGYETFYGAGLQSIEIPDSVTKIEDEAFAGCTSLESVKLPSGLTELSSYIFGGCTSLESVVIPNSVTDIETKAFQNCTSLTTVRLPETIKSIGDYAFKDCSKLKYILFWGDAPQIYEDIFKNDTLTAYYPGDNTTWTKSKRKSYGGDVKWKKYNPSEPADSTKERSAVINKAGTVSARFYLMDEDGYGIADQPFSYVMHANGKAYEYNSGNIITDLDGGYVFTTPYYSNSSSEKTTDECWIEVEWSEADGTKKTDTFTINVTVSPLAYTESWSIGLDATASNSSTWNYGVGNTADISLTHNTDGSEDLTLSLSLLNNGSLNAKTELLKGSADKVGIIGKLGDSSVSGKITYTNKYSTTIYNFDPDKKAHQNELTAYLSLMFMLSTVNTASLGNVFLLDLLNDIPYTDSALSEAFDSFEISEKSLKVKASGGTTVLKLDSYTQDKNKPTLSTIESLKLGSLNAASTFSSSTSVDSSGSNKIATYTAGLRSEKSFALLSGSLTSITGYSGLSIPGWNMARKGVSDTSVSVDDNKKVTCSISDYDSGYTDSIGYDELYVYNKYTANDELSEQLISENSGLANLYKGYNLPMTEDAMKEVVEDILGSKTLVSHTETEKLTNTYSWSPSISIPIGKSSSLTNSSKSTTYTAGLSLSASHGWSTTTGGSTFGDGVTTLSIDSGSSVDAAKKDASGDGLGTLFASALSGIGNQLVDAVTVASGAFGAIITIGVATITKGAETVTGWTTELIGKAVNQSSVQTQSTQAAQISYSIMTFSDEGSVVSDMTEEEAEETEKAAVAATVGDACVVRVTDDDSGEEITELGDHTLTLELSYTAEDLEAADALDEDLSALAMYRYDEENDVYVYVGGTVDTDTATVTATISETGQYVLALDGAVPVVSQVQLENETSDTPSVCAQITDFSGIQSMKMLLDDEVIVSGDDFENYYNKKTGEFRYTFAQAFASGEHTISFEVTDAKGNTGNAVAETFRISEAPEITEIYVQPYAVNGSKTEVSAKVSAAENTEVKVTASVIGHKKNGDEIRVACTMKEKDGTYKGVFYAEDEISYYTVALNVTDDCGNKVTSEEMKCEILSDGVCTYKDGSTTYKVNLCTGTILKCTTSEAELEIPDEIYGSTIEEIASYAFEDCTALAKVTLGSAIEAIGEYSIGYYKSGSRYVARKDIVIISSSEAVKEYAQGEGFIALAEDETISIDKCRILMDGSITLKETESSITNSGTPGLEIYYGNKELEKGTDYTVVFSGNSITGNKLNGDGTGTAVITGCGYFSGTVTKTFHVIVSNTSTVCGETKKEMIPQPVGSVLSDSKTKASYKVTSAHASNPTVEYRKSTNKKATAVTIPATVKIDGVSYKVTSIAANAFKGNKKLKKVVIGANIVKIGKNAFYGDTKLTSITIKTTKLTAKSVGSKAFGKLNAKVVIKVPKSTLKAYQKLLQKKGVTGKKQKIKK